MIRTRENAIVIGGSLAGLLAARVLSERFAQVTIVDHDQPTPSGLRRGVPQAHHVHILLERGAIAMETIVPGLRADLAASGAPEFDFGESARILLSSGWTPSVTTGVTTQLFSRPLLEQHLRRHVLAATNVTLVGGFHVNNLLWTPDRTAVRGISGRSNHQPRELTADFVVDASGRTSQLPRWLANAGLPTPPERIINAGVSYTSRRFHGYPDAGAPMLGSHCVPPDQSRGGAYSLLENDQCIVTLIGIGADSCPPREQEFIDFAHRLPQRGVAEYVDTHAPIGGIRRFADLGNRWRLLHRFHRWPTGLVALGDAVCVFNPIYAQGMTVAALHALELGACLDRGESTRSYQQRAARIIHVPWIMATTVDMAWQSGHVPVTARLASRFLDLITARIPDDPELYRRFVHVQHMRSHPARLVTPSTLYRLRPRRQPTPSATGSIPDARPRSR